MSYPCSILTALLVALQAGCLSWQQISGAHPATIPNTRAEHVRVVLEDGPHTLISSPHVRNDSLLGFLYPKSRDHAAEPIAVPLSAVRAVEVRRLNAGKTATVVAAGGMAFAVYFGVRAIKHALEHALELDFCTVLCDPTP